MIRNLSNSFTVNKLNQPWTETGELLRESMSAWDIGHESGGGTFTASEYSELLGKSYRPREAVGQLCKFNYTHKDITY